MKARIPTTVAIAIGAVALLGAPASSRAAVTVGSDLATVSDSVGCLDLGISSSTGEFRSCGIVQTALPGREVTSPIDGVLVRWRVRGTVGSLVLAALRPAASGGYESVGSEFLEIASPELTTIEVRRAVRAGDVLGLELRTEASLVGIGPAAGAAASIFEGSFAGPAKLTAGDEFLFNADIEPDADGDRYGDETQDGCPVRADRHGPCTDLEAVVSGPTGNVFFGDELTFTIEARNHGPQPAADTVLIVPRPSPAGNPELGGFPNTLQPDFLTSQRGACAPDGINLRCPIGTLAPGEAASVVLKARSYRLGPQGVTASAHSSTPELNHANTSSRSLFVVVPRPGRCANVLTGTAAAEVLAGTLAGDKLLGLAGNDLLSAGGGADCLNGGAGDDRLRGGAGADQLDGGKGNDDLRGEDGADVLVGGPGRNRYSGGAGNDRINARNGRRETVSCGAGRDRVKADRSDRLIACES